jgi:hypothetical protein
MIEAVLGKLLPEPHRCQEEAGQEEGRLVDFDGLAGPLQMVSNRWDFVKGFKFEFNSTLTQYFMISQHWNIPNTAAAPSMQPEMSQMMGGQKANTPNYSLSLQLVSQI